MSCQDKIDEQFVDPEKTDQPSIPKFFTYMIDNSRVRPEYWNIRTFVVMHPALYTQSVSYLNANKRYQQQFSYLDDYWRDYYTPSAGGVVAELREMERLYATMTDEEKALVEVFMHAAKVLYYDQTAQMVDMWGDIPFTQAGSMSLNRDIVLPEFDKAEDIYNTILAGLEEEANYFAHASPVDLASRSFTKQDILMQGSLEGWRRYANSLRLRALMRISNYNPGKAETDVMKMLNSPVDYPLVDDAGENILLAPQTTYLDNMRGALTEVRSHLAPRFLLDNVLKPAADPRIRVMYDKNVHIDDDDDDIKTWNPAYYSMPNDIGSSDQEFGIAHGHFAVLDSVTFLNNKYFPGIVFTSYETGFLKAEAYERWGTTTDAEAAYNQAVKDAVRFTYYLHTLGLAGGQSKEDELTNDELDTFMANGNIAYTGTPDQKLQKIWLQKWVAFGFWQSTQNWAEVRRTNYPVLPFVADTNGGDYKLPSSRLVYPPNEKTYNAVNYAKVSSKDTPTTKIFWDVN
jgi:hypothetical protein